MYETTRRNYGGSLTTAHPHPQPAPVQLPSVRGWQGYVHSRRMEDDDGDDDWEGGREREREERETDSERRGSGSSPDTAFLPTPKESPPPLEEAINTLGGANGGKRLHEQQRQLNQQQPSEPYPYVRPREIPHSAVGASVSFLWSCAMAADPIRPLQSAYPTYTYASLSSYQPQPVHPRGPQQAQSYPPPSSSADYRYLPPLALSRAPPTHSSKSHCEDSHGSDPEYQSGYPRQAQAPNPNHAQPQSPSSYTYSGPSAQTSQDLHFLQQSQQPQHSHQYPHPHPSQALSCHAVLARSFSLPGPVPSTFPTSGVPHNNPYPQAYSYSHSQPHAHAHAHPHTLGSFGIAPTPLAGLCMSMKQQHHWGPSSSARPFEGRNNGESITGGFNSNSKRGRESGWDEGGTQQQQQRLRQGSGPGGETKSDEGIRTADDSGEDEGQDDDDEEDEEEEEDDDGDRDEDWREVGPRRGSYVKTRRASLASGILRDGRAHQQAGRVRSEGLKGKWSVGKARNDSGPDAVRRFVSFAFLNMASPCSGRSLIARSFNSLPPSGGPSHSRSVLTWRAAVRLLATSTCRATSKATSASVIVSGLLCTRLVLVALAHSARSFNSKDKCTDCTKTFSRRHDCTRHMIAVHSYPKDLKDTKASRGVTK